MEWEPKPLEIEGRLIGAEEPTAAEIEAARRNWEQMDPETRAAGLDDQPKCSLGSRACAERGPLDCRSMDRWEKPVGRRGKPGQTRPIAALAPNQTQRDVRGGRDPGRPRDRRRQPQRLQADRGDDRKRPRPSAQTPRPSSRKACVWRRPTTTTSSATYSPSET